MPEIQGKIIAQKILDSAGERVKNLRRKPSLAVVMVGDDPVSAKYVAKKAKAAEEIGIEFNLHKFPADIKTDFLTEEVIRTQLRSDAIIVQLPLPQHVHAREVLDEIDPDKDVDCLSSAAIGRVVRGSSKFLPPTAGGILEILKELEVDLEGKHVVIVGQGELVGKPAASVFMNLPVTLTVCGLGTEKLSDHTKKADILISGTGQAGLITADMVKKGAVVIDAGTSMVDGKVAGDVDFEAVMKKAKHVTPVFGGMGPLTVAKLLENVVTIAEKK